MLLSRRRFAVVPLALSPMIQEPVGQLSRDFENAVIQAIVE
jgi:hypothetical protein